MQVLRTFPAKAVAALVIVVGLSSTALVGGAAVNQATAHSAHAGVVATHKVVTCTKTKKKPIVITCDFNATFSGTISIIWHSSGPSTATIKGKGKGAEFGMNVLTGAGTSTASAQVDPINGAGTLSGAGETLHVKLATGATASAVESSAPTLVTVSGTAKVTKGTGTFLGATGKLKVSGEFNIQKTTGKESDSFSATLKGVVTVN